MSDSAVPDWLREILPGWFAAHPAFTEAAYAFLYSAALGVSIVLSGGAQQGAFSHDFPTTIAWFKASWWQLVTAAIAAGLRGRRAYARVVATPSLPRGS